MRVPTIQRPASVAVGIGTPYDPKTGQGQIGRNFTHQTMSTALGFFDKDKYNFNPFVAVGRDRHVHRRVQRRQFRSRSARICRRRLYRPGADQRPADRDEAVPPGTPAWGAKWKQALQDNYLSTINAGGACHGSFYSYRDNYLDLDPTYKDRFGRPLMRMTMDFPDNEIKMSAFLTDKYAEIIKQMGAKQVVKQPRKGPYDMTDYQTSHLCGGAIMGDNPKNSAFNRYLQSWDVPNLFVQGATAFPQNAGYNPTGTVGSAGFLVGKGDPLAISQKSRAAGRCVSLSSFCDICTLAAPRWRWRCRPGGACRRRSTARISGRSSVADT